jgi:hypothetical protein
MPESKKVRVPTVGYSSSLISRIALLVSATLLLIAAGMRSPFDITWVIIASANFALQAGALIWTMFFGPTFTVEIVDNKPIAVSEKKQRLLLSEVTKIEWKKIGCSFQLHLVKPSTGKEVIEKAIIYLTGESGAHLVRKKKLSLLIEVLQATSADRSGIEHGENKPGYFFPDQETYEWAQSAFIGVDEAITELRRYVKE